MLLKCITCKDKNLKNKIICRNLLPRVDEKPFGRDNKRWMVMNKPLIIKKNECGNESRKVFFGVLRFNLSVFPFNIWTNFIDKEWENEMVKRRNKGRREKWWGVILKKMEKWFSESESSVWVMDVEVIEIKNLRVSRERKRGKLSEDKRQKWAE